MTNAQTKHRQAGNLHFILMIKEFNLKETDKIERNRPLFTI